MAEGVTIVNVRDEVRVDGRGQITYEVRVEYLVDNDGPFYLLIPKDQFNGAEARRGVEQHASEIRRLRGK